MALLKEGCVWATSGMRSSWVLPVEDKEEVKAKYLEYKQRGYEVDIRATDKTIHMPSGSGKSRHKIKKGGRKMYVVKFRLNRFVSSSQATQDCVAYAPDYVKIEPDPEQSSSSWGRGDLVDIDEYYVATADRPFTITLRREITAGQGDSWEWEEVAKNAEI